MHNEEFLSALDNSPTYSRTAQELESIEAIIPVAAPAVAEETPAEEEIEEQEKQQ